MKEVLAEDNLIVNETKSEVKSGWRNVTKLGDEERNCILKTNNKRGNSLLQENWKRWIWIWNQQVGRKTKVRLYEAIVKPVPVASVSLIDNKFAKSWMYNVYPDRMKNKEVYS